jgi:hypothetical protein
MTYLIIVLAIAMAAPIVILLCGYALAALALGLAAAGHAIAWLLAALARLLDRPRRPLR